MSGHQRRLETCARKIAFKTWDEAEEVCLRICREAPIGDDPNPPAPYPCDLNGSPHYHVGHIRRGRR